MVILSSEVTKATLSGSFGRREHSSGLRYFTPVSFSRRINSFEIWLIPFALVISPPAKSMSTCTPMSWYFRWNRRRHFRTLNPAKCYAILCPPEKARGRRGLDGRTTMPPVSARKLRPKSDPPRTSCPYKTFDHCNNNNIFSSNEARRCEKLDRLHWIAFM